MPVQDRISTFARYCIVQTEHGDVGYISGPSPKNENFTLLVKDGIAIEVPNHTQAVLLKTPAELCEEWIDEYTVKPQEGVLGTIPVESVVALGDGRIGVIEFNSPVQQMTLISISRKRSHLPEIISLPFGQIIHVLRRPSMLARNWIMSHYPPSD